MQVFKAALRVFSKHPIYISIYIVYLGFMGLFIGTSNIDAPQDEFVENRPSIAVIDRDGSDLSQGIADFIGTGTTVVELEDTRQALQDATAQSLAPYIAIIPEGFGEDFARSLENDGEAPLIDTIVSYESVAANMMNGRVNEYLDIVGTLMKSGAASTGAEAVEMAARSMEDSTDVTMVQLGESAPISQQYILYMRFSGYTAMLGIIVCIAVVMGTFNRTEVKKRDLASPVSALSISSQIAAACVIIALITWAWVNILGLVVFGDSLAAVSPAALGLIALASLAFCTVALSIGFLIGQLTTSEIVMNAAGNITGLVLSFLGGLWVPLEHLGASAIVTVAHFTPTFYYGSAIDQITSLRDFSGSNLAPVFGAMGIMLLFTAAIFAIALAIGRLRIRSAEAGGNAAAQAAH